MKTCPKCGQENIEGLLSCSHCQHWLAPEEDFPKKISPGHGIWHHMVHYLLFLTLVAGLISMFFWIKSLEVFVNPYVPFLLVVAAAGLAMGLLHHRITS